MRDVTGNASSSYTFIHLDGTDCATKNIPCTPQYVSFQDFIMQFLYLGSGHTFTWCSQPYLDYVNDLDLIVGRLLDVIEGEDVMLLLSSDHGGSDFGHGDPKDEDLFIPMFIKGYFELALFIFVQLFCS